MIPPNRLLVISGPNAGGKSVTMKGVGLCQLMIQSGILIPVAEESEVGIFKNILCDIGDQQSLEDDLSTYSSRLYNMKYFLDKADEFSMILIDEFGSGTDPKIGGALAESMLRAFNKKRVFGVITTHYSNIKYFAFKTKGIVNGSMLFDRLNLKPSYELKIGKPGSSFAFEIADKIGFEKDIIQYAKQNIGKDERAIDELLVKLQGDKKRLEDKIKSIELKEIRLNKLIQNYELLSTQLDVNRKKLRLDRKAKAFVDIDKTELQLKNLLKKLKKEKNEKQIIHQLTALKKEKVNLSEEIVNLKEAVFYKDNYGKDEFKLGAYVKLRESGNIGQLIGLEKSNAMVAIGQFQFNLKLKDIIPIDDPISTNKTKGIVKQVFDHNDFETKLDLRGYKISDAMDFVQEFIETAILKNADTLKILHGNGTGRLRAAIHAKLKEYKDINKVWHPEDDLGGTAVTFIRL